MHRMVTGLTVMIGIMILSVVFSYVIFRVIRSEIFVFSTSGIETISGFKNENVCKLFPLQFLNFAYVSLFVT